MDFLPEESIFDILEFTGRCQVSCLSKTNKQVYYKHFKENKVMISPCSFKGCNCIMFNPGKQKKCTACGHEECKHNPISISEYQNNIHQVSIHKKMVLDDPCVVCDKKCDARGPWEIDEECDCICNLPICESCWLVHFNNGNSSCPMCDEQVGGWLFDFFDSLE